jgi:RNA polymerase sigma-B factor
MGSLVHRTELELIQLVQQDGDEHAREALILRHRGLVHRIAGRYARRGLAYDDIVQSGQVGLIQAVDRFDAGRGVPLARYAARTIEGEIMHLFRDHGWAVRVPRPLQELSRRTVVAREELSHRLGRSPELEELARFMDEPPDQVAEAVAAERAYQAEPLTAVDAEQGHSVRLPGAGEERGYVDAEHRDQVAAAVRRLSPRDRAVVHLRFYGEMSQSEIARRLDISQMQVSRSLRASLDTLREAMDEAAEVA